MCSVGRNKINYKRIRQTHIAYLLFTIYIKKGVFD
jgi:hypothetical protein